jgi:hypothetical protein
MNYDQNDCPTVFSHNPTFFLTLTDVTDTLKTKVGDVVGCIFEVECTVGGFLILKQIISMSFMPFMIWVHYLVGENSILKNEFYKG